MPVLVVMGVSGSGKSTVAGILSGLLEWELLEGDDVHPKANVDKMAAGHALTDEDRWPWLETIAAWITERTDPGRSGIVTCSSLKRRYRDVLRRDSGVGEVIFVHLTGKRADIEGRLRVRMDHYMPASLLDSQFDALEELQDDEPALTVDIGGTPLEQAQLIIARLGLTRSRINL